MEKKHLILLIALLAIGFACYVLFGPNGKTVTVEKIVYKDPKTDTIILPQNVNAKDVCLNYESFTPSELATSTIYNLVNNYRINQLPLINATRTMGVNDDAHSIWFDLDTIKKFIYHIEQGVKNNNALGSKLGLRIYYATYPNSFTGMLNLSEFEKDPEKAAYTNRHTLVMLPTITKNGFINDFNPNDANTFSYGLKGKLREFNVQAKTPIMALAPSAPPTNINRTATTDEAVSARNHGQLAPPFPTDGEAF